MKIGVMLGMAAVFTGSVAALPAWADQPDQPTGKRTTSGAAVRADDGFYDLVVLGDGPGALTAAYAGGRKKLRVCWVRGTDEVAIPRIGEKLTLNLGPMFRLSAPMFHLMTFADTPNMLLNEMRAITNLTICARKDAGAFKRAADGSIESYTFLDGTNRVTVTGRVWADGGQLGRTGDCQVVELADMVNHNESLEGTVTVAGDFPEMHFVPFGAFLVRDTPNLFVATRNFGATPEAKAALKLSDETDSQAGALATWLAHSAKTLQAPLKDFASFDDKFLALFWENILTGNGFGSGSMYHAGWEAYDQVRLGYRGTAAKRPHEVLKCRREDGKWIIPAGDYFLEEPLVFTAADSGTPEQPAVYEARGKVTISAGRAVTGWTVLPDGAWRAEVPWAKANPFRQLSVNGTLRTRARHPNKGFFTPEKDDLWGEYSQAHGSHWRLFFREGDFDPSWKNPASGEVISYALWTDTHLKIQRVNAAERSLVFRYPSGKALWGTEEKWWGSPLYRIENVYEVMDLAGEWCLDQDAGVVYYRPLPGETPANVKVIAPCLERAVVFRGEPGRPCANVVLRGVRIADANYDLRPGEVNDMQASIVVAAAVLMTEARDCALEDCTVENVCGYAVEMRGATRDCAIRRCRLQHLGAGGVHLQGANWNQPLNRRAVGCEVSDCDIGDYGRDFASAVGILLRIAEDCKIVHNHVHDGYYTGISVGWNWGYSNVSTRNNLIAWNHIHDIGKHVLSDMGGIYTLGLQSGSVLRGNVIHDVQVRAYGGWGIYNDEGTSGMLVEKNLVYDVKHGGYNLNYGRGNTVRNNVFAFGEEYQISTYSGRNEQHFSTSFYNNIVHWETGTLDARDYKRGVPGIARIFSDYNLFSGPGAKKLRETHPEVGPGGVIDQHTIWADAGFVDAAKRDFRLKPDSPALKMGFEPVDWSKAGPRVTLK